MPASEELKTLAIDLYRDRFGVVLPGSLRLEVQLAQCEVWATSALSLVMGRPSRPPGLRIARWFPQEMKPTSVFLTALGDQITRSRVSVTLDELRVLLRGQRVPHPCDDEGFVALVYAGDVIGCARARHDVLHALLPAGRRSELLHVLDSGSPPLGGA